jgi:hypothetical protein
MVADNRIIQAAYRFLLRSENGFEISMARDTLPEPDARHLSDALHVFVTCSHRGMYERKMTHSEMVELAAEFPEWPAYLAQALKE